MTDSPNDRITKLIQENRIVLFMKGNRTIPMCGFSATVVQILERMAVPYETVDVLEDPGIRDGIKKFSQWPTIPQLYVDGTFVGGCDIVRELYARGELEAMVKATASASH